ncbi:MAG: arginine--tRNA ligase [Clostridia bacterium]|nr:arginine--tRNA ligase [Clostridia bacterium]
MNVKKILLDALKETFLHLNYSIDDITLTFSAKEGSDFQCNSAFSLAKKAQTSPEIVANAIMSNLKQDVAEVSFAKPGFINFKIKDEALSLALNSALADEKLGVEEIEEPETVIMDYGGANVAKELHIGHLRSPVIGESFARLYKLLGNKVITDTHLGDWGLQMGLTIAQLEDDGYIDGYFDKSKQNKEITLDTLNEEYPKASIRKNNDEDFRKKAETYTKYVQDKKEPFWSIYNAIREISVKRIKANYENLNCFFDLWYGESTCAEYVEPVVQMFIDKGLTRVHDGALVVDVAREGENIPIEKKNPDDPQLYKNPMPPVYLKKSNGADVYDTTDIATIYQRNLDFSGVDKMIYFTDKRQYIHFEHCFRAVKLVGISPENQKLEFIGFGTINGTDGKPFKTRSGDTIKLEDIINLISNGAAKKLKENGIEDEDGSLALKIGVAAMKFGDLSNIPSKDYIFDIDKFASFEGKTGPYIQYTGARINSLLRKAGLFDKKDFFENLNLIDICDENQRNIAMSFLKLQESYHSCYKDNSLVGLCNALYDFASSFAKFYNDTRILTEKDEHKKNSYLALCYLVLKTLKQASNILAFEIPEKM